MYVICLDISSYMWQTIHSPKSLKQSDMFSWRIIVGTQIASFWRTHQGTPSQQCFKIKISNITGAKLSHEPQKRQTIHLWEFLKELLLQPESYKDCINWVDKDKGVFKIDDSARVARLWGKRKNRPLMNYDKLSRSIRQYYKKNIIKKTENSKRLVYQFCYPYLWFAKMSISKLWL